MSDNDAREAVQNQVYVLQYAVENLYAKMRQELGYSHEIALDEVKREVDDTLYNSPMCDPDTIYVD